MEEAKVESSPSHFTPHAMQMILLQLTSISSSGCGSMMKMGCRVGAQHRRRVMYSFNFRVMTWYTKCAKKNWSENVLSLLSLLSHKQIWEEAATF